VQISVPANGRELVEGFASTLAGRGSAILRVTREADVRGEFARSVVAGLEQEPRRLDCRYLYDARGSELYEQITRQPEYYPTRTEASILSRHAREIREMTGPVTLVELGSGSSAKTEMLLKAYVNDGTLLSYVPVDVSGSALKQAGEQIRSRRPNVQFVGIHGTYQDAFPLVRHASPLLMLFLGSTIGNLDDHEASCFLRAIRDCLRPGDFLLLGVDLVKEVALLEAAYDDAAGITAAFTRNLFARMNRELGSDLDVRRIEHLARFDDSRERIEIHARFSSAQVIKVAPLDRAFEIAAGEKILVEVSRKFRLEKLVPRLASLGFRVRRVFTDERRWFGVLIMERSGGPNTHRRTPPRGPGSAP
jgi:L-histidine N-alpha-methyltransferase